MINFSLIFINFTYICVICVCFTMFSLWETCQYGSVLKSAIEYQWLSGKIVQWRLHEVEQHMYKLVLGWVTVCSGGTVQNMSSALCASSIYSCLDMKMLSFLSVHTWAIPRTSYLSYGIPFPVWTSRIISGLTSVGVWLSR